MRKSKNKSFYQSCMQSPIKVVHHDTTDRKTLCHLRFPIPYAKT